LITRVAALGFIEYRNMRRETALRHG